MSLPNYSAIVNKLTGGDNGNPQHPFFGIDNRVGAAASFSLTAGQISSLWRLNKTNGANGDIPPVEGAVCTRSTLGALPIKNASGGRSLTMLGLETAMMFAGVLLMYDRLLHTGGWNANTGPVYPATFPVNLMVPRNGETGEGNEIWIEIYGQVGASTSNVTVNYYNQNGILKTTPPQPMGGTGTREEGRLIRVMLDQGDTGVKGIESATLSGTTGSGGGMSWGVTVVRPITMALNEQSGSAAFRDYVTGTPILPSLPNDACISFAALAAITTSVNLRGMVALHLIEA